MDSRRAMGSRARPSERSGSLRSRRTVASDRAEPITLCPAGRFSSLRGPRTRPSLPRRKVDCPFGTTEDRRRPTVVGERPQISATARSDMSGASESRRPAASFLSVRLSGLPWAAFAWTAMISSSDSDPLTYLARMNVSCRRTAARTRWTPSRTTIV